jgi:methanethiol S-methyltransferase
VIVLAETQVGKAAALAFPVILAIITALFAVSFIVSTLLGFPVSLSLPLAVRAVGGIMVIAGVVVAGWVFRYRSPSDMIVSTHATFMKLFGRIPITEPSGRTEPLVVNGPQKYVRHPLYLGVILVIFGWGLAGAYTFVLVAGFAALLWFRVLIPFEERELRALFGDQYTKYMAEVPMLVPFTKRKKRSDHE